MRLRKNILEYSNVRFEAFSNVRFEAFTVIYNGIKTSKHLFDNRNCLYPPLHGTKVSDVADVAIV